MKILLIGATGQLGGDLLRNNPGHEILSPGRESLDLQNTAQLEKSIREIKPEIVINCAAFHNVPLCEEQPGKAFLVNCVAVGSLATLCRAHGSRLVTFSTDYVFDGEKKTPYTELDPPRPLQTYGITRAAGEYAAFSAAPETTIVIRTCGLYGRSISRSKAGNFVDNRVADAIGKKALEIASDKVISPTSTYDLSKAVLDLIIHPDGTPGIYHLVNEGECSWFELTKAIYEILGRDVDVKPIDRKGLSGNMRRPRYSVLANSRAKMLGISLPSWRNALERYLHAQYPINIERT